ncbi:DNA-binding dual transcriptional regulator OmpR [Azospirillaceae bacterium]
MEQNAHVLVVDDDHEIRDLLSQFLTRHSYRVSGAKDGVEMFAYLAQSRIDLIILDLMLPGEDGLMLCRRLRSESATTPIIMLTAIGDETDRIIGLEMGADDYLVKPFNPRELLARIKAVLRRTSFKGSEGAPSSDAKISTETTSTPNTPRSSIGRSLCFADWRLDLARRELYSPEGVLVQLSAGEFDLLAAFAEHPQRVLNRDQLLDMTRGRMAAPFDRSIDVQVSRLRRKIEPNPQEPILIRTVRGGGYFFTPTVYG